MRVAFYYGSEKGCEQRLTAADGVGVLEGYNRVYGLFRVQVLRHHSTILTMRSCYHILEGYLEWLCQ
jgi:hypothetical protein